MNLLNGMSISANAGSGGKIQMNGGADRPVRSDKPARPMMKGFRGHV
jgi:hypothetical protein